MELVVIRHGQSYVNLGDWDKLDSMDAGLTDLGNQQAVALRDWLKENHKSPDALYSSTMKRTRETATYVAEAIGLQPIFDDRIREFGNSYPDGQPIPEADLPRAYTTEVNPSPFSGVVTDIDNAESWAHFRIRIGRFLEDMYRKYPAKTVYVVAHGGVISAMFDIAFNVPAYKQCGTISANTGWTRFTYRPRKSFADWILHDHSRVDHLAMAGLL